MERNASEAKIVTTAPPQQFIIDDDGSDGKPCFVNILGNVHINDFVIVSDNSNKVKIAKILDQVGRDRVHVRWYLKKKKLPKELEFIDENGSKIIIHDNELVEDGIRSDNIFNKHIMGKCHVFYGNDSDSVANYLASNRPMKSHPKEMYVCRYKLVKKTVYKLLPVRWCTEEQEMRNQRGEYTEDDDEDEQHVYSDISRSKVSLGADPTNFCDQIEKLNLSSSKHESNDVDDRAKLVSPIKIVNNSVQKVKRTHAEQNASGTSDKALNKVTESEEHISPTKKTKFVDELNQNYLLESPIQPIPISSHSPNEKNTKMSRVKKNLNSSFLATSFEDSEDSFASPDIQNYSVVENSSDLKKSFKLTIRCNKRTPLKEHHDNVSASETPSMQLRNKTINRLVESSAASIETTPSKSILKNNRGSGAKKSPKRSVVIVEHKKKETKSISESITNTPTRTPGRRSTRACSLKASELICASMIDAQSSPEPTPDCAKTPSSRKSLQNKRDESQYITPKSSKRLSSLPKTPTNNGLTPQRTRQLYRSGQLTPSIQSRQVPINAEQSELEMIRERLHVSAVPTSLPCRENEFNNIYSFVLGKLSDECGGCIYISGVPGTGKTATVTQVIKTLQAASKPQKLPPFDFVEINGMRLTEPRQAYVQIYRQLTGKTMAWAQARDLLEKRFTDTKSTSTKKPVRTTILLVDELDVICNRKQDVVYNLFDWTSRKGSRLVAITIANTMDLPERVLKLKVASRLGLTRITFQPYSFKQLQEVVMARLAGSKCFVSDAVQLVARKVASISGDCRRALDICRRATEITEESNSGVVANNHVVNFAHVNQALTEMFTSPKVRAIKSCTKFEKLFLQAVASEITRTGIEEVEFVGVFLQLGILAPVLGIQSPPIEDQAMQICMTLGGSRLLIVEDSSAGIFQKIILNVSVDDLYYALKL